MLVAALMSACASRQKWEGGPILARPELVAQEFSPLLLENVETPQCPNVPMPRGLRPCCAFGAGLQLSMGSVPLPVFSLTNVIGVEEVGPHQYDHGVVSFQQSRPGGQVITMESDGLVYTCRGGFVDTAHLRDWADWTLYLTAVIARNLATGTTIQLADEAGQRRIVVQPVDAARLAQYGELPLAVPLAQWLAFQLSVWHEIATWYGWSATAFSEEASAFSPEDLYSNLLGIKTASVLIYQREVATETAYNEHMNVAIPNLLRALGAVSGEEGRVAMGSVDGIWWDSRVRLPAKQLVRRRNLSTGQQVSPWLVSQAWGALPLDEGLAAICGDRQQPLVLHNPDDFEGVAHRTWARLEIEVSEPIAARMRLHDRGREITQDDFPAIVANIRAQQEAEYGALGTRPEAP